jgi:hypothetical protein
MSHFICGNPCEQKKGFDKLYFSLHSLVLIYILIGIYLMLRQSYMIYQCNLLTVYISNGYVPEWIDE